jgi:hypothetical protein
MSYWNAFAKKFPSQTLLRLDSGSIFSRGEAASPVVNRYMVEGTYRSNLDGINMSAWDLPVWQEMGDLAAAGEISKEFLKVPLVSANVTTKLPNFPAFQRYIVKEFKVDPNAGKPLRVGITGLLFDPEERISRKDFQVQKPEDAARQIVADLGGKADYIIILTDMALGQAISLAVVVPGIHLLAAAHDYAVAPDAQQIGDSLIVGPVHQGQMLSEVRLNIKSGTQRVEIESHNVPLNETIPDDPVLGELIRKARAEVAKVQK